ncbi:MAG: TonB-dependent receptor [Pseudomonadota bacterium]
MFDQSQSRVPALLACALAVPASAIAQDSGIEEVVVTAQKRAENQQDVPISVQSIQGDALNRLGIQDAADVTDLFANVNTNAANEMNDGFTIRGVGTNNFHGNVARAVGVYQDEVYRGTPFSGVVGIYDMERVEVLRGPQNTLFGRNTTGGAINYLTRRPSLDGGVDGYALATLGNFEQQQVEGAVGFGLSDTFGVRFSGQIVQREGMFTNLAPGREGEELGERDRTSFRAQARWAPSDATDIRLSFTTASSEGNNIGNAAIGQRDPNDPSQPCPALPGLGGTKAYESASPCVTPFGDNPSTAGWRDVYNVSSAVAEVDVDTAFLNITHDFNNGISLTSITAVEETSVLNADDNGGGPVLHFIPHQDADYEQFSQEFRLSGGSDNVRWIAGLFYFEEDMRLATIVRRDANGRVAPPPAPGAGQVIAYNFMDQDDTDLSAYGQIEFDVAERTTITTGLRFTNNEKEAVSIFGVMQAPWDPAAPWGPNQIIAPDQLLTQDFVQSQIDSGANLQAVPQFNVECGIGGGLVCANGADGIIEQDLDEWGGKIGIDHTLDNGTLLYASYSRGFKSGGFDTRALAATQGDATVPVDPETLDALEFGFKWDSEDGRLRLNGAVFLNQWNDQQVFAVTNGIPALTNVPESELYGAEVEMLWAPSDSWLISGGLGLLESEITDDGGLSGVDEGHELRNTPPISLTGSVRKDIQLANGTLDFFAKFRYQDEMVDNLNNYVGTINGVQLAQDVLHTHDAQFVLDARVTYAFGPEERYSIALWGDNLTGEEFCHDIGLLDNVDNATDTALTNTANCSPAEGEALYGITARFDFN